MRRRRYALLLLAILACPLLASCDLGRSDPEPAPNAQQVLRMRQFVLGNGAHTLDPALGYDDENGESLQVMVLLYSGLITYDQQLRPVPSAAESVQVSSDGLTYSFHLRHDLRFSDSTAITSADFAYSIDRALNPCVALNPYLLYQGHPTRGPSPFASYLEPLRHAQIFNSQRCQPDGVIVPNWNQSTPVISTLVGDAIQTPDPVTIVLTLDHPDGGFLSKLAMPFSYVVDRRLIERYGDAWTDHLADNGGQGASGMYKVRSAMHGQRNATRDTATLVYNPTYWGKKPRLHEVDLELAFDPRDSSANPLDTVDVQLPPLLWDPRAPESVPPGWSAQHGLAPELTFMMLNWKIPPFDDLRVRQALALAIDRTKLAAMSALPVEPSGHLVPAGMPGFTMSASGPGGVSSLTGDPDKARALWLAYVADVCHWDSATCAPITLIDGLCGASAGFPAGVAEALLTMWRTALPSVNASHEVNGRSCGVKPATPTVCTITHPMSWIDWAADYPDPRTWLVDALERWPDLALCIDDPRAQALLQQADTESDAAKRMQVYQALEQELLDTVAVIPLYQSQRTWVARQTVAGYSPGVWYWLSPEPWADIYIAKSSSPR